MLGMNRCRLRLRSTKPAYKAAAKPRKAAKLQQSSRTGLKALPPELLLMVHRLLSLQDLKSAVLVNKEWNRVGEDPGLWSRAVVTVNSREDIARLSVRRLARLQEIRIAPGANWGKVDWKLFFKNVEKLAQVKEIRGLRYRDLKGVDSGMLVKALKRMENVELWGSELTSQQFTSIFHHIAMRDTKIKKLELVHQDLKAVDSGLLARALNGLENVGLWGSQLTPQHITCIFNHLAMPDTQIKKLELGGQDLSVVPTDDLSVAVSKLESVELTSSRLTTVQLTSILRHIVDNETKVKILSLRFNDLSAVEGYLINRAKNKLSQSGGLLDH